MEKIKVGALYQKAVNFYATGRINEAKAVCHEALKIDRYYPFANHMLAMMAAQERDFPKAIQLAQLAIRVVSSDSSFYHTLAFSLRMHGQIPEAERASRRAVELTPQNTEVLRELGINLSHQGRFAEAREYYEKAVASSPLHEEANFDLALSLLAEGEYERGWKVYEGRSSLAHLKRTWSKSNCPFWAGEDLTGKSILVHTEQGFGDMIQFSRFLPLLREKGADVILASPPELTSLFELLSTPVRVASRDEPLPSADCQTGLMSLPHFLGTTLKNIPSDPYITPDKSRVEWWQNRTKSPGKITIGLVWAGRPEYSTDQLRALFLSRLTPLLQLPYAHFFSLQKGKATEQLGSVGEISAIEDLNAELTNFTETAAAISSLDLVISVDTAVAHLSGALGKPTWILLPYYNDWRWLRNRENSPWYPSDRLFRQKSYDCWDSVIADVTAALDSLCQNSKTELASRQ